MPCSGSVRRCVVLLALLAVSVVPAAPAVAAPPCPGCVVDVPAHHADAVPLLVVLHGDNESAATAASRWRAATRKRGWALLSLQCPTAEHCEQSWWRWDGNPAWVEARVGALASTVAIDRDRVYLAGWSGGATYLGFHATAWPAFAAVVIHGGGRAPFDETCPATPLPAYFLVGDKNPLHYLMRGMRDYLAHCKQPIVWDVVRGADHDGERVALTQRRALTILDWLAKFTR